MRTSLLRCALAALLVLSSAAAANDLIVGVIATRESSAGAAQTLVATSWAAQLRALGGIFGQPVRLLLGDDGGSPEAAVTLAQSQVDAGALAIICCTTAPATEAVVRFAETAGVTLLSPIPWPGPSNANYWAFSLAPSDTDVLSAIVADAYRRGRSSLALLAPDTADTAAAARDLTALGALVGIRLASDTRYPVGQTELRPDALLVASTRPGGVVVWGTAAEVAASANALQRRGYEGAVYGRTGVLYPGEGALPWRAVTDLLFAVAPAVVATQGSADAYVLPGEREGGALGTCAEAAQRDAARLRTATADTTQTLTAAPVLGGLDLVAAAFEQLLALQIPLTNEAVVRQALRDTLVGLPVQCSGAGALDLEDGRRSAVLPRSLAIATATPTGLVAK